MTAHSSPATHDVVVIGCGLIGLACAAAAADRGATVRLIGEPIAGAASLAAAGLLAPSIERADGDADMFGIAARDRYPTYIAWLRERTGIDVPLNRDGIIQIAVNEAGVRGLTRAMSGTAQWLDARTLAKAEPALSHALGGVLHPIDGAVDNVRLHDALSRVVDAHPQIVRTDDTVVAVSFERDTTLTGKSGVRYSASRVVLAAGAWSNTIAGLPRPIPVEPIRGQMISYEGAPLRHAVYGPTGYVVPRGHSRTLVGATTERAGFESATTADGVAKLQRTAIEILPALAGVSPADMWAGLRPMSSDLHPILGPDPDEPRLLYATGHSRNGVLMTPLTGDCIASLITGDASPADIAAFSISRFVGATSETRIGG